MKQNDREELKGMKIPPEVLLREILMRWRIILLCAVLFAGLFAGYRYLRHVRHSRTAVAEDILTTEVFKKGIAITEEKIESRKEYLAGSILAEINPYRMAYAEASVFLSGDQDTVNKVMHSLSFYVSNKFDWSEFAREHGTEERYMKELVGVAEYSEQNCFFIRIRHRTEEEAGEMMSYLLEGLAEYDEQLKESCGAHTYDVTDWQTRTGNDSNYADWAEAQFNRIPTLETVLENFRKKAGSGGAVSLSKSSLLKYMVLGGVLGALIAVFAVLVFIFMKDRLLDARELKALYGIKNLAVFPAERKAKKSFAPDRWIESIGRDAAERIPEEERCRIAGEKLAAFAPGAKTLALTGDVKEKALQTLSELLAGYIPGAVFAPAPAPDKNADSVRILREADAVILVGEIRRSCLGVLERQIDLAEELGRPIAGSIVL